MCPLWKGTKLFVKFHESIFECSSSDAIVFKLVDLSNRENRAALTQNQKHKDDETYTINYFNTKWCS